MRAHWDASAETVGNSRRYVRDSLRKPAAKTRYVGAGVLGSYIHLSADGLYVGSGFYKPPPKTLANYRQAVDDEKSGSALQRIVTALKRKGYEIDTHDRLRSAPRGIAPDHPRIELLRMKDMFAGKKFKVDAWMSSPAAAK